MQKVHMQELRLQRTLVQELRVCKWCVCKSSASARVAFLTLKVPKDLSETSNTDAIGSAIPASERGSNSEVWKMRNCVLEAVMSCVIVFAN